jgi:nitroreductase
MYFYRSFHSSILVKFLVSNPVIDAIKSRRSIRSFEEKAVPEEAIQTLLEAATYAPTAMNLQPWKFTVVSSKSFMNNYSDKTKPVLVKMLPDTGDNGFKNRLTSPQYNIFNNAPLAIFISGDKSQFAVNDCSMAAQNMMLAAYSLGLGSCWIGTAMAMAADSKVKAELGVPKDHQVYAAVIFGYPKDKPKAPPRKAPQILKQIK